MSCHSFGNGHLDHDNHLLGWHLLRCTAFPLLLGPHVCYFYLTPSPNLWASPSMVLFASLTPLLGLLSVLHAFLLGRMREFYKATAGP